MFNASSYFIFLFCLVSFEWPLFPGTLEAPVLLAPESQEAPRVLVLWSLQNFCFHSLLSPFLGGPQCICLLFRHGKAGIPYPEHLIFLIFHLRYSNSPFHWLFFLAYFNKKGIKANWSREGILGQENLETYLERAFEKIQRS